MKLKVRTCLLLEAAAALLLPLYYFFSVRVTEAENTLTVDVKMNPFIFLGAVCAALLVLFFIRLCGEKRDESAREILLMADAHTLRASLVLLCAMVFASLLLPFYTVGYLMTGGIFLLFLLRYALFAIIDGKGVVNE